jgi:DNA repair exonuclease SbcCD nuclease subunit
MRGVFTGDWHVGPYRNGPDIKGVNGRFLDILARIDEIIEYCITNEIKQVFFLGDMFRDRQPDNEYTTAVSRILCRFNHAKIHFYCMMGNHDMARFNGQEHALAVYKPIAPGFIHIIDEPSERVVDGIRLFFFPYAKPPQGPKIEEFMTGTTDDCVLLMHGSVEGVQILGTDEYEIFDKDEVQYSIVKHLKAVFCGHIHRPQQFANVYYPGAVERLTFNDEGDERGFVDAEIVFGEPIKTTFIPVAARRMITLHAMQVPGLTDGTVDVKDAIVRVKGVHPQEVDRVKHILQTGPAYWVANIQSAEIAAKTETRETVSMVELIKKYMKKVDYLGDVESATKVITETLNSVGE